MANALINESNVMGVIAKEALMQLKNKLVFANLARKEFKKEFVKVGDTVNIRKPVKFYTADGATRVNQDVTEGNTSIVIDKRKHVSWGFSTQDLTLTIEQYSKRYIEPAMITLAQTVDKLGSSRYVDLWNSVGTPGTTPNNYAAMAAAAQRMTEMAVPNTSRHAALNSAAFHTIAGTLTTLNMPQQAAEAWKTGEIGNLAGFRTYETVNLVNHTVGEHSGTPLVNGADQDVTYASVKSTNYQDLVTDGWGTSAAVLKAGDVFTIDGVYAVNPVPGEGASGKTVMPYLQQFTVRSDVTSDGSGNATISISPAIIEDGPYQTVSVKPADNAGITVLGTADTAYPQNMTFHEDTFALVTCPLELPEGAAMKARESSDGLSVRVVKDYDIDNDTDIIRCDILFGWKTVYPELGVRLWG
ncbi:MAG: P22 phage major capsid protein family protein [Filomicrobium sp.]